MVEIGSLAGVSTEIFSKHFKNTISIDPYMGGYDPSDINSQQIRLDAAKKLFKSKFDSNLNVKQFNITSQQASKLYPNTRSIDLVYIDACHTYESVMGDIRLWKDKCRYIGGHDWEWKEVKSAVLDCFDEKTVKIFEPNHWIVRLCNDKS